MRCPHPPKVSETLRPGEFSHAKEMMSAFHPIRTFDKRRFRPWTLDRRQDLTELEPSKRGGEMAFERASLLLRVGNRSPHDDAVCAALLNVHDEHRAMLPCPLRACLDRRRLKVRIARTQRPTDMGGQFRRGQRGLHSAAAKRRSRAHYQRQ